MNTNAQNNQPLSQKTKDGNVNYWKQIIADYEASNLTRSIYCRQNQINYDNFGYWYRKLKNKPASSLIPVTLKSAVSCPDMSKPLSTLVFKNGSSLHIYDKDVLLLILKQVI